MSDVDRLLREYIEEHRAGGGADPAEYLARVEGVDRRELGELIDAYLSRTPRAAWDPEAFEASPARPLVDSLVQSLQGEAGTWPSLLPRLRARARVKRSDLVARLAEALGVREGERKVARYYHEMELGSLPASGVSDRVLEALGAIVGETAAALRRAGEALPGGPASPGSGQVYARGATFQERVDQADAAGARFEDAGEEWDEVDRLFRGGG